MMKELIWIQEAYKIFAIQGPSALKVEPLAQKVGKSKSSFYHFFLNMEDLIAKLLEYHKSQAEAMSKKESEANNEQEFIEVIIEHRLDLLFNRQLRVHRSNANFEKCFNDINQVSVPAMLPVWKNIIGLTESTYLAEMVLMLSLENFFLQITEETLNEVWLKAYFAKIRAMVHQFKSIYEVSLIDGSV